MVKFAGHNEPGASRRVHFIDRCLVPLINFIGPLACFYFSGLAAIDWLEILVPTIDVLAPVFFV